MAKKDDSCWTIETLKEYFERILIEKDKAINIALAAAKEAVAVAENNAQKWRENANEWREAMNDKDKNLLHRTEFLAYKESTERANVIEKSRADKTEGKSAGIDKFIGWIVAAAAILGLLLKR